MNDGEAKKNYKAGHVCSDNVDMIDGKPTGAVRVSFGYTSTMKDVDIIVSMIRSHFQNTFIHSCLCGYSQNKIADPFDWESDAIHLNANNSKILNSNTF